MPYENGAFHLVEQYRYPVKGRSLEFPQGSWEDQKDAPPESVAAGEFQEESDLVLLRVTVEEFEKLVLEGRIKDGSSLSAYSLLRYSMVPLLAPRPREALPGPA